MKPHHLKSPFNWHQRHVLVSDRVWYVPDQFDDFASFTFPGWDHPDFFEKKGPVCIEYCSGNGGWIAAKALAEPEFHWVAVEKKFDRVRKVWSKIKKHQLRNLMAVCGEGLRATQHYFPSESVRAVYINFPDPWPKTRHAKHRIVQPSFVDEMLRILEPGGSLTMVTDDEGYSEQMIKVLLQSPGFRSEFTAPYYCMEYPGYGTSYFEDLWRKKGKTIRYHKFLKVSGGNS